VVRVKFEFETGTQVKFNMNLKEKFDRIKVPKITFFIFFSLCSKIPKYVFILLIITFCNSQLF